MKLRGYEAKESRLDEGGRKLRRVGLMKGIGS